MPLYRSDIICPEGQSSEGPAGAIDPNMLGQTGGGQRFRVGHHRQGVYVQAGGTAAGREGHVGLQTAERQHGAVRAERWAGWGPIILANDGFKPGKVWKTADGEEFKVELVLIDDPVAMRDAYAAGEVHIGWATLDMVPLFMEGFVDKTGQPRDSRVMPRIYQQIDWSNGGDGIVVREYDQDRGRSARQEGGAGAELAVALFPAQHARVGRRAAERSEHDIHRRCLPSRGRVQCARRTAAAAVSWAPDIYNLAEAKGNRMLVTTQTANKLIADVWFARADFAKDHGDKIEAIVRGIFDAMEELKKDDNKARCAKLMADGYNIPASETIKMFGDAHNTNWAENFQFFLNQNNPTNFERVWSQAYYLYRRIGSDHASAGAVRQSHGFFGHRETGQGPEVSCAKGRVSKCTWHRRPSRRFMPSRMKSSPTRS